MVLADAWRMHRTDHLYSSIELSLGVTRFSTPAAPLSCRGHQSAAGRRISYQRAKSERPDAVQLRNQLGAQPRELLIGDRS
jgi:hypothetical protein